MIFSERYQKALVTVAMNLITEDEIRKNGLYRFSSDQKNELIACLNKAYKAKEKLLVLKIKSTGFRSEHLLLGSKKELNKFIENLDETFSNCVEILGTTKFCC